MAELNISEDLTNLLGKREEEQPTAVVTPQLKYLLDEPIPDGGDGTADDLDSSTWDAASNSGVKTISLSGIGNISSIKFQIAGASVSGGCKINDITVVYRTTRREPATGVN